MNQDPLLNDAKQFILETQIVSVAALQRRFPIGFYRGTKIMEQLEQEGVVSKPDKSLKRQLIRE
nr:DNA translocase FtsK [uncultured Haemophilus sp.]